MAKLTLNENEVDLIVSIMNCLIERLPQDEYDFDQHGVGWSEEDGELEISGSDGEELEEMLEWVLTDVINQVCIPANEIRCKDCICLTDKDGYWFCDEVQKRCRDINKCPEMKGE